MVDPLIREKPEDTSTKPTFAFGAQDREDLGFHDNVCDPWSVLVRFCRGQSPHPTPPILSIISVVTKSQKRKSLAT